MDPTAMSTPLDDRVDRLAGYVAVQNLMSTYQYLYAAGLMAECAELFARRDDSLVHVSWGHYQGWTKIRGLHVDHLAGGRSAGPARGTMYEHPLSTPVIEVAGDGRTAKGVWWSQGPAAGRLGPGDDASVEAFWSYVKYACDFIRDDDCWRIWHLAILGIFLAEYEKSWVEVNHQSEGLEWVTRPALEPDGPPFLTDITYRNDAPSRPYVPAAPEPYHTFDEAVGIRWCDPGHGGGST
jgi:hypothetical protein